MDFQSIVYLVAKELLPGDISISTSQITRRWIRHIKKPLGIKADFYFLKHLNIDETAELLNIQEASKMAGHATTSITLNHYAVGEKNRQHEMLKKVNNSF